MRVAFQGEQGAYSEEAAYQHFPAVETVPRRTLREVFDSVAERGVDAGIVPVENSEAGSINQTYDLLLEYHHFLTITGETNLRVVHYLLGQPGTRLADVRRVYSHPQALAQCDAFLRKLEADQVPHYDTAGSAQMIAAERRTDAAAVASRRAAELYTLEILAEEIQTNPQNYTRFLVIQTDPVPRADPSKTSVVFGALHKPGALYNAMGALALRGINLTKLESRPARRAVWEYVFYVDIEGHSEDPKVADAITDLRAHCAWAIVLGAYPAGATP
ncbi:MAG: prephenate dehydratase [Armatimonadetes bacterium]|nr:prephenate dehydratase [Armatimonadota bacterium]